VNSKNKKIKNGRYDKEFQVQGFEDIAK
jgi:hypothetical protein